MEKLLYYPSFEVENENWLKFALLYIDKLRPIVPASGHDQLSDLTNNLLERTDLYDFYKPSHEDSYNASLTALDIIEGLIRYPERYYRTFYSRRIDMNLKDRSQHTFLLYGEKYSYDFANFCLQNGLASESPKGVLLNPDLGNIYMTILSNTISEMNNIHCITDNSNMQKYNIFSRYSNFKHTASGASSFKGLHTSKINIAQSEINLALPKNISDLDFNTIIDLRNSRGYKDKLRAFHNELDQYIYLLENNKSDDDFIEHLDRSKLDLFNEFAQLGPNLFSFGLGIWFALNAQIDIKDIIGTFLIGGAVTATVAKVHKLYVEGHDIRFTRKYLSTLNRIPT